MESSDPKEIVADLRQRLVEARRFLDLDTKEKELDDLREEAAAPALWENPDRARTVSRRLARYEALFDLIGGLSAKLDDAEVLLDMAHEAEDPASRDEAIAELGEVSADLDKLELESLFFDEYDEEDAILSVHAGAGGVDAQDWADMLARMYQRFLTDSGFSVTVEEVTEGEEAGIKSATFTVRGTNIYGLLSAERGVHRLVRISPYDAQKRRHTSFASLDVIPALEQGEADEIEVDEADLRIDVYRSSGPGGQGVNTTDSAVRITHIPSGLVVACQNERSQLQNKATAMGILKARLAELERQRRDEEMDQIRGERKAVDFGSQIRSYVLAPYQMVKDHRTDEEIGDPQRVLDGDIDRFIEAELRRRASG
jgi:peptide chain release factor 2